MNNPLDTQRRMTKCYDGITFTIKSGDWDMDWHEWCCCDVIFNDSCWSTKRWIWDTCLMCKNSISIVLEVCVPTKQRPMLPIWEKVLTLSTISTRQRVRSCWVWSFKSLWKYIMVKQGSLTHVTRVPFWTFLCMFFRETAESEIYSSYNAYRRVRFFEDKCRPQLWFCRIEINWPWQNSPSIPTFIHVSLLTELVTNFFQHKTSGPTWLSHRMSRFVTYFFRNR